MTSYTNESDFFKGHI